MKVHENLRNCFNCENWAQVVKFMSAETGQEIFICETCLKKAFLALQDEKRRPLQVGQKVLIVAFLDEEYRKGSIVYVEDLASETDLKYKVQVTLKGNEFFYWFTRDQLNLIE